MCLCLIIMAVSVQKMALNLTSVVQALSTNLFIHIVIAE